MTTTEPPIQSDGIAQWSHRFQYRGRDYTLFKRLDSKSAPYYVRIQRLKKRTKQALETNDRKAAIDRAKTFINAVIEDKWDLVNKLRVRKHVSTLKQVLDIYGKHSGLAERTMRNNVLSVKMVLRRVNGQDPDPELTSLTVFTKGLAVTFQDITSRQYQDAAPKDDPSQREARERSYRSSRSTLNQARSLFSQRPENDQIARYEAAGLVIPPNIKDFMECRLRGKTTKGDYLTPPDTVVKKAFERIEEVKPYDPNLYKAFWLAVGAGLRRKEIQHCKWEHFVERDGFTWISGGIGKDGKRIEVPIQSMALEKLAPFRKPTGRVIEGELGLVWATRLNTWMRHLGWQTEKKLHELRAYIGSLIYRQSPQAAMKFMRHKSIKQTEEFYCRYGGLVKPVDVL